jgi:hypothetical protein
MIRRKMRISPHHVRGLPPTELLQSIDRRARLYVP